MSFMSWPLINHLANVIYFNRKNCCNSGIPYRPENLQFLFPIDPNEDLPTKALSWGLLSAFWASRATSVGLKLLTNSFIFQQIHMVLVVLRATWRRFLKKQHQRKTVKSWQGLVFIAICLCLWTVLCGYIACQYLLVNPSSKLILTLS